MSSVTPGSALDRLKPDRSWLLLIFALILPTIVTYVYFYVLSDKPESVQKVGMSLCKIVQFGLPVVWVLYVRGYWPDWKTSPRNSMLLTGLISGLVVFAAAMMLYHGYLKNTEVIKTAAAEVNQRVAEMGFSTPLAFIGLGVFYVVLHSLLEEYYWRWFVFGMLKDFTTASVAMWVSSLGFMAHHVLVLARYFGWASPATWLFSACVAIGGLIWSWMYHRTGKLYGAWLSHAIIDAVIFVIGFNMLNF